MEIVTKRQKAEPIMEDGIVLCEVCLTLPQAIEEGSAAIRLNRFYGAVGEAVRSVGREAVLPRAREEYRASDDPRKRMTSRPYRLLYECRVSEDAILSRLCLSHRGRVLFNEEWAERILPNGAILPIVSHTKRTKKTKNER